MNVPTFAQTGYAAAAAPIRTDRGTEFDLFARVTRALKSAEAAGPKGFRDLAQAILDNRRLWIALAADVAAEDNALPQQLRAQIFYLAEFTNAHSTRVLRRRAGPGPLIDINTAIMRGLSEGVGR